MFMKSATLKKEDLVIENPINEAASSGEDTGYPFNLTEDQVTKLIFFFAARRNASKAMSGAAAPTRDFTADESRMVKRIFGWFGFVAEQPIERMAAYKAVTNRFKTICDFLRNHPAYITVEIKKALEEGGYKRILSNIVMVVDKDGHVKPRVVTTSEKTVRPPIGQLDALMWEFQNVALDKLRMIIDSIDYKDVKKSNLGMKSKALRDIYSVIHMVRLGNKNPNMTLVNINVNGSEPKDKLAAYSTYVSKNREQNA